LDYNVLGFWEAYYLPWIEELDSCAYKVKLFLSHSRTLGQVVVNEHANLHIEQNFSTQQLSLLAVSKTLVTHFAVYL